MTDLRDQFAIAAMQALITTTNIDGYNWSEEAVAKAAYKQADAMMIERYSSCKHKNIVEILNKGSD